MYFIVSKMYFHLHVDLLCKCFLSSFSNHCSHCRRSDTTLANFDGDILVCQEEVLQHRCPLSQIWCQQLITTPSLFLFVCLFVLLVFVQLFFQRYFTHSCSSRTCLYVPLRQAYYYITIFSLTLSQTSPGPVFTNHSQERSLSFSPRFINLNVTQLLIG